MDNFGRFLMAQETLEAATQHHNYSGEKLRNAQIRARLAEIASQHEPLNELKYLNPLDIKSGTLKCRIMMNPQETSLPD